MYLDILYGPIDFGPDNDLIRDLLACPEVQRLRYMRLVNFDVPLVQELATARRYAHAIGTCFLAARIAARSPISSGDRNLLLAAALVHDIGIPPYGHLVEEELYQHDPSFSHEALVRYIIYGAYHPTNIYHQILPGRSLQLASVLKKWDVDAEQLISLVCPAKGRTSPINAAIDLDNIDNVHRMAALLGMHHARANLHNLSLSIQLSRTLAPVFDPGALAPLECWLEFRSTIYAIMIAHPECVAYNAFLEDLVCLAIQEGIISANNWYLSDFHFESKLLENSTTKPLALQLFQGSVKYQLVDYVWLWTPPSGSAPDQSTIQQIKEQLGEPPFPGCKYFYWLEQGKISRELSVIVDGVGKCVIGAPSVTLLVAVINHTGTTGESLRKYRELKNKWRSDVLKVIKLTAPFWDAEERFPEDFSSTLAKFQSSGVQLALFG